VLISVYGDVLDDKWFIMVYIAELLSRIIDGYFDRSSVAEAAWL
jgi:hypothetical protein